MAVCTSTQVQNSAKISLLALYKLMKILQKKSDNKKSFFIDVRVSAAELTGINRNSAILFFHKLRELIFEQLALETPELLGGEVELDESFFGGTRKGKRGRGAAGKVPVFGLLKRSGRVFVAIIPNASSNTLFPIIRDKIKPDSIVYTDSFRSYDALDVSEFPHVRINHSVLFADKANHINGIENF